MSAHIEQHVNATIAGPGIAHGGSHCGTAPSSVAVERAVGNHQRSQGGAGGRRGVVPRGGGFAEVNVVVQVVRPGRTDADRPSMIQYERDGGDGLPCREPFSDSRA